MRPHGRGAVLGLAGVTALCCREFVPSQDQSRLQVKLTTTVGLDLAETDRIVKMCEKFLTGGRRWTR